MALVVASAPDLVQVTTEVFRHIEPTAGKPDDNVHWVLFKNGTFYTFPKSEFPENTLSPDDLVARALDMSKGAELLKYNDNDCVTVLPYREFGHPTYVVLSCLRQKIGWVIVGETDKWAETEQQEAAVGYVARTKYEMDCEENVILATSFKWSAAED
uniref:Uncharacterized protein n=1 Tax=viral metagenome TaxID=1070528 RepID=A0A6C0BNR5_9ZZZZ